MGMDEEVDSKNIRIKTRKIFENQLRDLEKFTYMPQDIQSRLKEEWQQELCRILSKKGMISCLSIKTSEEVSRITELAGQKETIPKGYW